MKPRRAAALALLVLVCYSTGVAFSGESCQDKLVGNSYDCTFDYLNLGIGIIDSSNCIEFTTGGPSQNFVWVGVLGLGVELGCVCQTTGSSIQSFAYDGSANAFECVGNDAGEPIQFHGVVEGKKLHAQGSYQTGESIAVECRKRSTACE
jgi:hypothetical protein